MPVAGRKPTENPRGRNKPTHDWTDVEDVPFSAGAKLPAKRLDQKPWPAATKKWWSAVSSMPHCVLWSASDWQFALDTAFIAAEFHAGDVRCATELRNREKVLGTTVDYRRDLRIRYVEVAERETPAGVTDLDQYRDL